MAMFETCSLDASVFLFPDELSQSTLSPSSKDGKQHQKQQQQQQQRRSKQLSLTQLGALRLEMQCIVASSSAETDMPRVCEGGHCHACFEDLSSMIEETYKELQQEAYAYHMALQGLQQQEQREQGKGRVAKQQEEEEEEEACVALAIAIKELQEEEARLKQSLDDILEYSDTLSEQRHGVRRQINEAMQELINGECMSAKQDEQIKDFLQLASSVREELAFVRSLDSKRGKRRVSLAPLFDMCPSSSSSSSSSSSTLSSSSSSSSISYSINGFRLRHWPVAMQNLNWAEINAAWACACTCLVCLRNRHGLSDLISIEDFPYLIALRPLRRRALLILTPKVEAPFATSSQHETFILGGDAAFVKQQQQQQQQQQQHHGDALATGGDVITQETGYKRAELLFTAAVLSTTSQVVAVTKDQALAAAFDDHANSSSSSSSSGGMHDACELACMSLDLASMPEQDEWFERLVNHAMAVLAKFA